MLSKSMFDGDYEEEAAVTFEAGEFYSSVFG